MNTKLFRKVNKWTCETVTTFNWCFLKFGLFWIFGEENRVLFICCCCCWGSWSFHKWMWTFCWLCSVLCLSALQFTAPSQISCPVWWGLTVFLGKLLPPSSRVVLWATLCFYIYSSQVVHTGHGPLAKLARHVSKQSTYFGLQRSAECPKSSLNVKHESLKCFVWYIMSMTIIQKCNINGWL